MIVNYSEHASNERTFLSWVRTVIAIEGFGIVATRLGDGDTGVVSEIVMLVAGAVVIALAFWRMRQVRARIDSMEAVDDEAVSADAFLLLVVAALFALIAVFVLHVS